MPDEERAAIETAVERLLRALGVDLADQHFTGTPRRVARWLHEFRPPQETIEQVLGTTFDEPYQELVAVCDVPFQALCAHHLLPFIGTAHIGYIPNGRVVGLSKLPRALYYHAHRMTLQERITYNLVEDLMRVLQPKGAIVVLQSQHQCMTIRGVKATGASMITSGVRGVFLDNTKGTRDEFMALVKASRSA